MRQKNLFILLFVCRLPGQGHAGMRHIQLGSQAIPYHKRPRA